MPLYEFSCNACGRDFDAWAKPGGAAPCDRCGSADVARRWNAPATFRGPWLRGTAARRSDAERRGRSEARRERRGGG